MLFKVSEQDYQLKYFNSSEERDKPAGEIDLLQYVPINHINRLNAFAQHPFMSQCAFLFLINSITVASLSNISLFRAPLSGSRSCG